MIARTTVVVAAALLAGCTGTDVRGSAATSSSTTSGSAVTVTRTVTAGPTGSSAAAAPAATGPARCDAPALTVGVEDASGAAGSKYRNVVFRNGGEQPCFLRGYPGVAAADAAGTSVLDAARDGSRPVRVLLQPGQAAHAQLAMRDIPPDAKPCPTYPTLLVTPPDSRRTQSVTVDVTPCGSDMRVSVVLPGPA